MSVCFKLWFETQIGSEGESFGSAQNDGEATPPSVGPAICRPPCPAQAEAQLRIENGELRIVGVFQIVV